MSDTDTGTLDSLYLEWSRFTEARTARELEMAQRLAVAAEALQAAASALHLAMLASHGKQFNDLRAAREGASDALIAITKGKSSSPIQREGER